MSQPRVLILLPVYNGAPYLRPQLDSLLAQTFSHFHVLCRDDGSSDDSLSVLQSYARQHPQKFTLITGEKRLGASGSFSWLMEAAMTHSFSDSPGCYIALCDQDDIWHPDRLMTCIDAILAAEQAADGNTALIVHSDLRVIGRRGRTEERQEEEAQEEEVQEIAGSFMAYQGLQPERTALRDQVLSNTITGCTSLFNMALLRLAVPIPDQAIMHDWWLALTASAFGRIIPVNSALVDYRQHDSNTVGAREFPENGRSGTWLVRMLDRSNQPYFLQLADQSLAFWQRHAGRLSWRCRFRLRLINFLFRRHVLLSRISYQLLRIF